MKMSEIWDSFKAVAYGGLNMGGVVYVDLAKLGINIFPDKPLIFSGVTVGGSRTSTINETEEIIEKILRQEGLKITDRTFYDLQARKGYAYFKEGQFILNKISIKRRSGQIIVISWREIKDKDIPKEFYAVFGCLLGTGDCVNVSKQEES